MLPKQYLKQITELKSLLARRSLTPGEQAQEEAEAKQKPKKGRPKKVKPETLAGRLPWHNKSYFRQEIGHPGATSVLTLPVDPPLFSTGVTVTSRRLNDLHFKRKAFFSLLRSFFKTYALDHVPVVLCCRFYIRPPAYEKRRFSAKELRSEQVPAVYAPELCEYVLALLSCLHEVLFKNYRQVVRIETEKFYTSKRPRTELQFMHWENWRHFYAKHPFYTKAYDFRAPESIRVVQPTRGSDSALTSEVLADGGERRSKNSCISRRRANGGTLPVSDAAALVESEEVKPTWSTQHQAPRHRQPAEIPR